MVEFRWSVRSLLISVAVGMALAGAPLRAGPDDQRFLNGLRQRRLFGLAETYCRQRLAQPDLQPAEQAQLTIELIRTYTAHAVNSAPQQREALWAKAHEAADRLIAGQPDHPRLVLIRVQKALTHLARGQLVRQEMEAGAAMAVARPTALAELREAVRLLQQLDGQLEEQIARRRRRGPEEGGLSADELFSLQNNVRYHLARAYRQRALLYAADSADRIDALTRVIEQHRDLLKRLPEDDPLRWQIRVESIVCQRLLGNLADARQMLASLAASQPPADVQLRSRAEEIRLELAQGRLPAALAIAERGRTIDGQASPQLDFARLETYVALARSESGGAAAKWQKQALDAARRIEHTHGTYWARRANLLLVRSAGRGSAAAQDLELLTRVADHFYLQGQLDEAVQAYDKAARQALARQEAEQAFALFYKAALVEHGRHRHAEAAERLRQLGLQMKSHPKAADAHLLAVWNAAQLAGGSPTALSHYAELLEEHLATWPDRPTADRARIWLARVREHEGAWTEAMDIYLEVSRRSSLYAGAVEAAARCSQQHFAELKARGQPTETQAKLVAARFEDLIYQGDGQLPQQWSDAQRTAAVAAARVRLQFAGGDYAAAGKMLEAALNSCPDAAEPWKTTVRSLLVVALAGQQGRRAEAAKIFRAVSGGSPALLLEILDGLARIGRSARPETQRQIAQLQLDAIAAMPSQQADLDPQGRLRLERIRADALAASGRREEAIASYERLANEHPRSGSIQEGYARLLLEAEDPATLQKALAEWRKVDRASRPRSERWYRAKYSIALAHYKLGDKQRAAQLIEYLRTTPPGLERTPLKPQFEALLARCRGQ